MGPFQGFGPNWDQVPNLGHHYEHCSCYLDFFFSETKFSETETFFRDQIFSKPKPRLFFRNQIFRNRNRDFFPRPKIVKTETKTFFSETKFSKTETETFFRDQIFSKPKPRLFFPKPNFPKPKPSKVGKSFENKMSISACNIYQFKKLGSMPPSRRRT